MVAVLWEALVGVQVDDLADRNCLEKILDASVDDSSQAADPEVEGNQVALGTVRTNNIDAMQF